MAIANLFGVNSAESKREQNGIIRGKFGAPGDRRQLFEVPCKKYTRWTITSTKTMEEDVRRSPRRGWYTNIKESFADLAAISMAAVINGDLYGVSIAGLLHRMQPNLETYDRAVAAACAKITDQKLSRRRVMSH